MPNTDSPDSSEPAVNFIQCQCPHCDRAIDYTEDLAGLVQVCPHCGEDLIVPRGAGDIAHEVPLPVSTDRMSLRRIEQEDFAELQEFLLSPDLYLHESLIFAGEEAFAQWFNEELNSRFTNGRPVTLAIQSVAAAKPIGLLSLTYTDSTRRQMNLTILLNPAFQRQGFGKEALGVTLWFCFHEIGQHRLSARCDSRNTACIQLLARCKFRQEGRGIKDRYVDGGWADTLSFAILKEEFGKGVEVTRLDALADEG